MDSTIVHRTWVDFGFHVFDAIKVYLLPILGGVIAGSFLPQPHKLMKKKAEE